MQKTVAHCHMDCMQDSAMIAEHKASLVIDLAIVELPATLGHANRFTDTEENYVLPTPDEKKKQTKLAAH